MISLEASSASLKRYIAANLPEQGQRAWVTVLREDPPPGQEAQIDYGYWGLGLIRSVAHGAGSGRS